MIIHMEENSLQIVSAGFLSKLSWLSNYVSKIYDESESNQGHQDGKILSPRVGQPHKITQAENNTGVHMFGPIEYDFSMLNIDDNECVTIQGSSMEGISNSVSPNMHSVVVGNAAIKVTSDVNRDHEMQKENGQIIFQMPCTGEGRSTKYEGNRGRT
jgi:hypothetical protein